MKEISSSPSGPISRTKNVSKPSPETSTCVSLKELKSQLRGLTEAELDATSAVELSIGQMNPIGFLLIRDDKIQPRCPKQHLPMNNRALSTMVESLSKHYGKAADSKTLAFLNGGMSQPGYTQITLEGTGLGLYFSTDSGQPMGKLTGKL